jgi:hypothetical protein
MITTIPSEDLSHIVAYLSAEELYQLSLTNTGFNHFINDSPVLNQLAKIHLSEFVTIPKDQILYYCRYYAVNETLSLTALNLALRLGFEKIILLLLNDKIKCSLLDTKEQYNPGINVSPYQYYTSMDYLFLQQVYLLAKAAENDHRHLLDVLLKVYDGIVFNNGFSFPWLEIPLLIAAQMGNLSLVQYLMGQFKDIELKIFSPHHILIEENGEEWSHTRMRKHEVFNRIIQAGLRYNHQELVKFLLLEEHLFNKTGQIITQRTLENVLFHTNRLDSFKFIYSVLAQKHNIGLNDWFMAFPAIRFNLNLEGIKIYSWLASQLGSQRMASLQNADWMEHPADYDRSMYNKSNPIVEEMGKLGPWIKWQVGHLIKN